MIIHLTPEASFGIILLHGCKPQRFFDLRDAAKAGRSFALIYCHNPLTKLRSGTFSIGLPVLRFFSLRGAVMALLDMLKTFSTDEKCREVLTKLRWPEGVECPRCKERRASWLKARNQFECGSCGYQFSVTSGTVFNDSHLPLETWFAATYLLCEAKKGMSALQIKRTLGIGGYKTAWYLCHRIRHAMAQTDKTMLDCKVEMDVTYVRAMNRG